MHVAVEACVPQTAGRVPQPGPLHSGLCLPKAWLSPSPGSLLLLPRSTHHTHLALGGQWDVSHSPSGVMAALDPWLVRGQNPGLPMRGPQAAVTPPLTQPQESLWQPQAGPWSQAAAPSLALGEVHVHAACHPLPWPTASTCFLHNDVRGTWGTVLREPLLGWG